MTQGWRTARVYICSTLRDMHAERDHLVKVVFPALRERLEKYRIHLVDIDMRWGVALEQAQNDQVLDLVLQQIDECRPFFIGMLGERYGWRPDRFAEATVARYRWLAGYPDRSINEVEIIYGTLLHPDLVRGLFYFRDPAALTEIPDDIRAGYVESDRESFEKLADLKNRIRQSAYPVMDPYPARWDPHTQRLVGLEHFGKRVGDQLWQAIQEEFQLPEHPPVVTAADLLAEEQDYQDRFVESRLRVYAGREQINDALLAFADGNDLVPCLLTGPSGSGKSAALAKFIHDYQHRQPRTLVIPHFIGASPRSTNLRGMLQRFCQVFKAHFSFAEEVPEDVAKLSLTFRALVGKLPALARVVLVIDALNQLDEAVRGQRLNWLPTKLPPQIKVIISCINDAGRTEPVLEAFHWRKHFPVQMTALSNAEQLLIIRQVPLLSAKILDYEQVRLLLSNPATANPLFLLMALEELRGFASYEQVNERIAAFPREGDTITAIFDQVIKRLAQEFDQELIQAMLTMLASARRGLAERELRELVAGLDGADDLFPVLHQLRPYLLNRSGLIDFYYRNFFKAVRERYLRQEELQRQSHLRLAEYFELLPSDERRRLDELPWQLLRGQDWHRAMELVADLRFMQAMFQHGAIAEFREDCESILHHAPAETEVQRRLLGEFLAFSGAYSWILRDEKLAADEPVLVATLAFNRADSGPIVLQAAKILEAHHGRLPQVVTRRTRYSADNPLKMTLHRAGTSVVGLEIHPGGDAAFCGFSNGTIRRWDLKTGEDAEIAATDNVLRCVRLTNAGHKLCFVSSESMIKVCSADTGDQLRSIAFRDKVVDLVVLPDDTSCLVALANGGLCHLQIEEDADSLEPNEFASLGAMTSIAVSPSGQFILCGHQNGDLSLWDLHAKALRGRWHGHNGGVTSVAFHPAGNLVLSGGNDWAVRLWDVTNGKETGILIGHSSRISGLAVSPDGRYIVSAGGWDQTLLVWESTSGKCVSSLRSASIELTCLAVSPGARLLVSGGADGWLELWDLTKAVAKMTGIR